MIRYFYFSKCGHCSTKDLYKKLKPFVDENHNVFLDELDEFSIFYNLMTNKENESFEEFLNKFSLGDGFAGKRKNEIISRIRALKIFGFTQYFPMIYSLILNVHNSNNKKQNLIQFNK